MDGTNIDQITANDVPNDTDYKVLSSLTGVDSSSPSVGTGNKGGLKESAESFYSSFSSLSRWRDVIIVTIFVIVLLLPFTTSLITKITGIETPLTIVAIKAVVFAALYYVFSRNCMKK